MSDPSPGIPLFFRRVFPLIFIGAGVVMLAVGGYALVRAQASQKWPATAGTVVSSSVIEQGTGRDRTFHAEVRYAYSVSGMSYTGHTVAVGDFGTSNGVRARQIVGTYPVGAEIPVYYNPAAPEVSLLEPGITLKAFLMPGIGVVFIGAGVLVLVVLGRLQSSPEVSTGYRPRPVTWVTNVAPYYALVRREERVRIVAHRWPPVMHQLIAWVAVGVAVAIAAAVVLSFDAGKPRVLAALVAALPVMVGIAGILFSVYYANAAASRAPVLLIDRNARVVEVPRASARMPIDSVRAVQIASFRAGPDRSWLLRHLVLRCRDEHGERYLPVLEQGYPIPRLGRAIADELGVPLELVWAEASDASSAAG
jgi:hypothetical protein